MNGAMLVGFLALSSLGAISRFWLERNSVRRFGEIWPWGTLAANVAGSLLLGWFAAGDLNSASYQLAAAYCGAFTTFGGFIGQSFERMRHQHTRWRGVAYLLGTLAASLAAAWLGLQLGSG